MAREYRPTDLGTIVARFPDTLVVWNGSATFNVFTLDAVGAWVNTDCFTHYGIRSPREASDIAYDHLAATPD